MKKLLVIGAVLFLALAAFIFWPRSAKPFPDADLQVVRIAVPTNENAFFLLTQVTNEADFSEAATSVISDLHESKTWDSNRVSEVLGEYEKALDLFEKALELPRLQVPEIKSYDDEYPYLSSWRTLATLTSIKCKALFHSGNEKGAFDLALRIVRFGHSIEQCDGTMIVYMLGSAMKRLGFGTIRDMAAATKLSGDRLASVPQKTFGVFGQPNRAYQCHQDRVSNSS